jgi:protein-tyrosine phosphatase
MLITKVTQNIYRGPSPMYRQEFKFLEDQGFTQILDLQSHEDGVIWRTQLAGQFSMVNINIPMSEILPPTKEQLDKTYQILTSNPPLGFKIYVHCRTGVDRTGMVIANFRIKAQGWSVDSAIAEMKDRGMHWWYYWWAWNLER